MIETQGKMGAQTLGAALGLVILPVCVFTLASLYLLIGGSLEFISAWAMLSVSALAALALAHRTGGWVSPLIVVIVVLISAFASHYAIDTSYDGQRYHYDATRVLADGWNPYREAFQVPEAFRGYVWSEPWSQVYPWAAWLASAVPVAAGADIESAKLTSVMLAVALFFGAFGASVTWGLKWWQALALAVCVAANPVIIVQAFTRMNDGVLASCLGLCAIFMGLWLRDRRPEFIAAALGIMAFGLNLKFSAIPTFVILCGLIVALAWYALGRAQMIRVAATLLVGGVFAICVLGAQPYVTNTLEHQHPFYPIYGDDPVDIITMNRPRDFNEFSEIQRLAHSYFGPTSDALSGGSFKWPFVIESDEWSAAGSIGARLGGFGPLFSGAFLFAFALSVWIALGDRTRTRLVALGAIAALAVASLCMPEAWWARYVPQLWWTLPLIAVVALVSSRLNVRVAGWTLIAITFANIAYVTASSVERIRYSTPRVRDQIEQIAALDEPICVQARQSHARLELLLNAGVDFLIEQNPSSERPSTPLLIAGGGPNNPSYTVCGRPDEPSGESTSFTLTLSEPSQLSVPAGSPIRISALNGILRLQGYVANANSQLKTDGASVALGPIDERAFAGRRVRVTFRARGVDGATEFTAAYSTHGNGNSGWQTLRLTSELSDVSFDYDVPMGVFGGNDFVGIMPPVTGAVEIQSIRVAQ